MVCFRYNPGNERTGNAIIWNPSDAKYWFTREQLFEWYAILKEKWVKRFWLHTMIASNELNSEYFVETAKMLFELVVEINNKLWVKMEFVNIGWWIGIPYKPEQSRVAYGIIADWIKVQYEKLIKNNNLDPLKLFMECGRTITWPYWYLVTKAIHEKNIHKKYIWVDACMANLMRPALYWAYHHITVLWKENIEKDMKYDVVWSLCENNDKFAVDRDLPKIDIWDTIVIHDSWAHWHAMGFNYNWKLRSKELLLRSNWEVVEIRREETIEDYFITLDFQKMNYFE
ncbi:MAG: hypothetical protein ACD_4C00306G0001 [uncultured bacterium (gcode 4)]|uniref:Orn/DAP/Arg decarboxylase 2 C-terminal domain-containing protein n=1 Tax=uncultured bacterium (gcode 4) TaxID=1234023 RepID=K2GSS3_9BACT|nr:MAG: hypothetical protein ACD_4C00306G0001 [uncultured bacterium (gcode 4)]